MKTITRMAGSTALFSQVSVSRCIGSSSSVRARLLVTASEAASAITRPTVPVHRPLGPARRRIRPPPGATGRRGRRPWYRREWACLRVWAETDICLQHYTEVFTVPIATPEVYAEMLGRAKANSFAYPAINCTSSETINAAIKGFADAGSDGIIQFSTGGSEFGSGQGVKDMVTGAVALAEFAHVVAAKYDVTIALHTDHCPKDKLDGFVRPLLVLSQERVNAGKNPLFQSHMWDGSAIPIDENLQIAQELLKLSKAANIILEVEIGVVGGEEDGVEAEINEKLYTSPADFEKTIDALGAGENGKYLLAATFGNVHGVYKPGNVVLRPEVLAEGQRVAAAKLGLAADAQPFDFVFHGGSGSLKSEIDDSLRYGVVKMNVDTDTQYAFTRPVAAHMFTNYDGVLKVDGEVGNKKAYDPRSYLKKAELSMAERVVEACNDLRSAGRSISA
ncbi:class II fructose-bisphosphate aldolase [Nocardia brevicatena]|uniref:class II fructose-bisphosphate aldolase n=1 Tax=Nocardia brevicatena TaxID=37327 RepID=UPI00278C7018|nr:class II fructose-bisphosphate aldolase [Nocardia brevicatena]